VTALVTGMTNGPPVHLSQGLAGLARRLGSPPPAVLATVFGRWAEIVGPGPAERCRPLSVRRDVLVVAVTDSAMATEARYQAANWLRRAAELAGCAVARSVEVRVRPPRSAVPKDP